VLELEQFDDQRVAGFGALDRDGTSEGMDRVEAGVREVLDARVGTHLPVEGVAALEADDLAGFDRQNGVDRVVPDVMDVLVRVAQFVVDLVVVCHTLLIGGLYGERIEVIGRSTATIS
jgi:hypothetical protein